MVILYDDTSFEAKVVGKDPKTDVALLKNWAQEN
jgi:S1-C subfamily serine protease